jgi:hypothetical protein
VAGKNSCSQADCVILNTLNPGQQDTDNVTDTSQADTIQSPNTTALAADLEHGKEFRWKPFGLIAAVIVALFAVGVQYLAMQGAVVAGLLSTEESAIDATMVAQTAAWAAAPLFFFSLLIEPLVKKTGAMRAVGFALLITLLAWTWAGFEAWRAAHGISVDSLMPNNGLYSGALVLVLPLPLFLLMAVIGRFGGGRWWPVFKSQQTPDATAPTSE